MKKRQRRNQQLNQVAQPPLKTEPSSVDTPAEIGNLFQDVLQIYCERHKSFKPKDALSLNLKEDNKLGSSQYLFDRKFDLMDKELQNKVKDNENSKKFIILNYADKYEQAGYPLRSICKRISDVLSHNDDYNTSPSYVRKILPEKYKDYDQMEVAKKQSAQVGASRARLQEEVARKDVKDIVVQDFNYIKPSKAKLAFKHQLAKAVWFEQENRQLSDELESLKLRLLAATWRSR